MGREAGFNRRFSDPTSIIYSVPSRFARLVYGSVIRMPSVLYPHTRGSSIRWALLNGVQNQTGIRPHLSEPQLIYQHFIAGADGAGVY